MIPTGGGRSPFAQATGTMFNLTISARNAFHDAASANCWNRLLLLSSTMMIVAHLVPLSSLPSFPLTGPPSIRNKSAARAGTPASRRLRPTCA